MVRQVKILNGAVNRHNCRYWREDPPEASAITKGVNVWCGLHSGGILGPTFIDEIIDGLTYQEKRKFL